MDLHRAAARGAATKAGQWWRSWRARFGLAEVCGTVAAIAGFAIGYRAGGSLLTAAGLATLGEFAGFYGCIGTKAALAAWRVTAHLAGWRRLGCVLDPLPGDVAGRARRPRDPLSLIHISEPTRPY